MNIADSLKIDLNQNELLNQREVTLGYEQKWVSHDTAILVVHGIGNQYPLETLDSFGRGLIDTYYQTGYKLSIEHRLAKKKKADTAAPWFDNFLRIRCPELSEYYLDVYEYYWAPETEGQATFKDLNRWLTNVTNGARKFYKNNVRFAKENEDRSVFIKGGEFSAFKYWFFVNLVPNIIITFNWLLDGIIKIVSSIPGIGALLSLVIQGKIDSTLEKLSNVLNDVSIYNTTDPKSRFFSIKNCILDGAVDALRYLLEAHQEEAANKLAFNYGGVLVAGHSLGSQIAFDAINRINHLINQGEVVGYDQKGNSALSDDQKSVAERLKGIVTFGSPLDKIAFFFREQVSQDEQLRSQMLSYYHGFKQRDWIRLQTSDDGAKEHFIIQSHRQRLFEDIHWRNYWDAHDYVSGALDYYKDVVNVDCRFDARWHSFTHSRYWDCSGMYLEIINYYLC